MHEIERLEKLGVFHRVMRLRTFPDGAGVLIRAHGRTTGMYSRCVHAKKCEIFDASPLPLCADNTQMSGHRERGRTLIVHSPAAGSDIRRFVGIQGVVRRVGSCLEGEEHGEEPSRNGLKWGNKPISSGRTDHR